MACTVIAILASLRLVPLVNVTSIDPLASTAFSVIFIPDSEAGVLDSEAGVLDIKVDNIFQDDKSKKQIETEISNQTVIVEQSGIQNSEENVTDVTAQVASSGTSVNNDEEHETSLMEEYISATGWIDSKTVFDRYMPDYTSNIIQNVESEIDLSSFIKESGNGQKNLQQAELIAVRKISLQYPLTAQRRGIEGYSVVEYEIDNRGIVKDAVIIESSPGSIFNRSSLRAIQRYIFEPPKLNGQTVSMKGRQTKFIYQLKSG